MTNSDLARLQKKIGVNFKNESLIKQALVHRSYLNEHPDFKIGHNERLEFLGDAVLEIVVTEYLYLSKGEARDKNKKSRQFILANSIEAIIGAIYLDQGIDVAKEFILKNVVTKLDNILTNQTYLDPKSRFQEKSQEEKGITPHYQIIDEVGPDHAKIFTVGLYLGEELITTGKGSSKQEAQVEAAANGLKKLNW